MGLIRKIKEKIFGRSECDKTSEPKEPLEGHLTEDWMPIPNPLGEDIDLKGGRRLDPVEDAGILGMIDMDNDQKPVGVYFDEISCCWRKLESYVDYTEVE